MLFSTTTLFHIASTELVRDFHRNLSTHPEKNPHSVVLWWTGPTGASNLELPTTTLHDDLRSLELMLTECPFDYMPVFLKLLSGLSR